MRESGGGEGWEGGGREGGREGGEGREMGGGGGRWGGGGGGEERGRWEGGGGGGGEEEGGGGGEQGRGDGRRGGGGAMKRRRIRMNFAGIMQRSHDESFTLLQHRHAHPDQHDEQGVGLHVYHVHPHRYDADVQPTVCGEYNAMGRRPWARGTRYAALSSNSFFFLNVKRPGFFSTRWNIPPQLAMT